MFLVSALRNSLKHALIGKLISLLVPELGFGVTSMYILWSVPCEKCYDTESEIRSEEDRNIQGENVFPLSLWKALNLKNCYLL